MMEAYIERIEKGKSPMCKVTTQLIWETNYCIRMLETEARKGNERAILAIFRLAASLPKTWNEIKSKSLEKLNRSEGSE